MRLTSVLLRFKKKPPNGHVWRGKYRLWKAVTPQMTAEKIESYQMEERNLFYLRHPYLTFEQAEADPFTFDKLKQEEYQYWEDNYRWRTDCYLGDRLGFMKLSESWE